MQNSKRHILYLNADRGIPVWGESGGSAHIRDFTSAAVECGAKVTIVSARCQDGNSSVPQAEVHKIKFSRYGSSFHKHWLRCKEETVTQDDAGSGKVAKEIRSFYANTVLSQQLPDLAAKHDFTLVYERYSLFSFAARGFAKNRNLPYVLEVNSPLIDEALLHRHLYLRELADSVAKYLFTSADRIVAVSNEVADYVRSVAPEAKVSVMPNAVNPARFCAVNREVSDSSPISNSISQSLEQLQGKFVVGYLGSLRPWHGLNNLLEAFSLFSKQVSASHLLIIGDGKTLRPQLEQTCSDLGISERVTFTGEAPNAAVPRYLSYCDTLVAPYPALERFYFSPLKIFEYMASGAPIIASDIGQISELLSDNETGLLVTPGDVAELVTAMRRLYEDSQLGERLAKRAYDQARKFHSWDVRMKQMLEIFDKSQPKTLVRQVV